MTPKPNDALSQSISSEMKRVPIILLVKTREKDEGKSPNTYAGYKDKGHPPSTNLDQIFLPIDL